MRVLAALPLLLVACERADQPKDSNTDETGETQTDMDGDGWNAPADCDDESAAINPGAAEVCDDLDNDCDGLVDDNATDATTWYADSDSDGYGGSQFQETACDAPAGFVDGSTDCNDLDADTYPGADELCDGGDNDCDGSVDEDDAVDAAEWYFDEDGDGYGIDSDTVTACDGPRDYVSHAGDCDDEDPAFHPGASESDCADANDYNCDGSVGYEDLDADGFAACEDCDDNDATANPDGSETCDDVDNDCDGVIDDDASDVSTWYADADGDSYGSANSSVVACDPPGGFVADNTDCDDLDAAAFPGGAEVCDDADNDCDGSVDEGVGSEWYADADGDGYGDASQTTEACEAPAGYVANGDDCDDTSASTSPAAYEICDSVDNDCDGQTDEADAINSSTFYVDGDNDGYGDSSATTTSCSAPTGYAANDGDCNDADSAVSPAATEVCDSVDNDCDGQTDEPDASGASTWYIDNDGDAYGGSGSTTACDQPNGYVNNQDDCDDADSSSTNTTIDGDCDGTTTALDCDDTDAASTYVEDDEDCDGTLTADDCDDTSATSTIVADDADCDGTVTADDCDDGDSGSNIVADDADCDGYLTASDCNDNDASINPGATETNGDSTDSDCDGFDDLQGFSGTIEMPASGTVQGYNSYWKCTGDMRTTTRVLLTQSCVNPTISIHQHAQADTSIYGSYYITDASGTILEFSTFETHGGCNDCFLTPTEMPNLTLQSNTYYHLGFQNEANSCDMSGPSVYVDTNARTVGVATFDDPRMDQPGNLNRGLPSTTPSWQNRWQLSCQ